MSILSLATAVTLALAGVGAPVPAAVPSQNLASESPAPVPPVSALVPTTLGAPSPRTAPATGSPVRISAIHIERPVKTVTLPAPPPETETVVIEAPAAEEDIVAEAREEEIVDAGTECVPPKGNYNGVREDIAVIGAHIQDRFGVTEVVGKAGRDGPSEHPRGLALDFMTNTGNVDGDAIRDYLLDNADEFGIKYVIWERTLLFPGKEPQGMEDRGGDTANHFDHVHVSFDDTPGSETPSC